ncbi:hypothetical protein GCM10010969_35790 [Saccharibacillus kuerlensis]|uniref:Uncharacterized protein n=1 Tax=Saccharibacillus kuerlensis TaxID=459527 RepID=A0ABQ2L975_9BACL|nr:hypothetical protein GCM10010969_35790 [Saccharibacillus kuerlensis]
MTLDVRSMKYEIHDDHLISIDTSKDGHATSHPYVEDVYRVIPTKTKTLSA